MIIIGWYLFRESLSEKPPCQQEVMFFDKQTGTQKQINGLIDSVKSGALTYSCKVIPSTHMQPIISKNINHESLKNITESVFGKQKESDKYRLECQLIENDKLDPGKKSQTCKLHAGLLLYTFYEEEHPVYKIQMDVMEDSGTDIPVRVECIRQSLHFLDSRK